jgi:hypothetical protein
MTIKDTIFQKSKPNTPIHDPNKERREQFMKKVESVMSEKSKSEMNIILTSVSGDCEYVKYIFMAGYASGNMDLKELYSED